MQVCMMKASPFMLTRVHKSVVTDSLTRYEMLSYKQLIATCILLIGTAGWLLTQQTDAQSIGSVVGADDP